MGNFLKRHSYLVVWVLSLVIIGAIAILVFDLNDYYGPSPAAQAQPVVQQIPAAPAAPSVTFVIQKSKTGNSFFVQWQHLPGGTTALEIFRGETGTPESTWTLWKTLAMSSDQLGSGSQNIDLGTSTMDEYSFYIEAVNNNGGPTGSSTDSGQTVLWISSSTIPTVTTSTPPENSPPSTPPSQPAPPPESPSSSPSATPSSSNSGVDNGNPTSTATTTPAGIPYYNPQVQIDEYGSESGNFWVQHVNQSIEIGWQDLPPTVDEISVSRSASSTGPWNTILVQQNPSTSGSYSLQIIDDTVNDPYYYQMTAENGTTTVATYGPIYLAGQ